MMKRKRFINVCLLAAILVCNTFVPRTAVKAEDENWPKPPEVGSGNAILIDADTGEILYEKNAHEKAFPASTTKLVTALLIAENCNLGDRVTFSYEAAHSYEPGDSNIGIWAGEEMSVEEALRGILMESANEACYGMAEYVSGTTAAFVEKMNEKAAALGAKDTHFTNTNGLHDNYHYTTCYDMAMIGRACFDNATIMSICKEITTYTMPPTNKYKSNRYMRNKHALLKNREYYYPYSLGGKTGYTEEAGHTLVSFAQKDNIRLVCVVMRSDNETRYKDTTELFEYGFNNFEKHSLSGSSLNALLTTSKSSYNPESFFPNEKKSLTIKNNIASLLPLGADKSKIYAKADYTGSAPAITFYYYEHALGSSPLLIVSGDTPQNTNLPIKLTEAKQTDKGQEKHFKIIKLKVIIAGLVLIAILFVIADYRLIMTRTVFGQNVKRRRETKKRKKGRL